MNRSNGHSRRRVRKSREAIVDTFKELVFKGHYAKLGVRELARKAGVGRSTFYEHFDDKMSVLVESMYPLLSVLADAAAGYEAPKLRFVLAHFEERRKEAVEFFGSVAERNAIESGLAKLVGRHLPRGGGTLPAADVASTLARVTLGLVIDWLTADPRIGRDECAAVLRKTALAVRGALLGP